MKFIPILYSTPMVQAINEDRKTQTRRTKNLEYINEKPDNWFFLKSLLRSDGVLFFLFEGFQGDSKLVKCPYGQPGDVLWVRETFHYVHDAETNKFLKYGYKADWSIGITSHPKNKGIWRPSIHMPKEAARLFLQIQDIRVERLQDISENDAIAEGVAFVGKTPSGHNLYKDYRERFIEPFFAPENSFMSLWVSINGQRSWMSNPWVWVIEFEKIYKPENFLS